MIRNKDIAGYKRIRNKDITGFKIRNTDITG